MNKEEKKTSQSMLPAEAVMAEAVAYSGTVKVHESVIASIVRKATCAVPGVVRLAGSSLVDNLAEIVGSKKMYDRAISINMGDNSVQVEIKVILAYGTHIPEIAEAIQLAVIGEITKITGMQVNKVNVVIIDLEEEQDQSDAE